MKDDKSYMFPPYHRVVRMVDIDGTLIQKVEATEVFSSEKFLFTSELLAAWRNQGDYIVLWTARPEALREETEEQMSKLNIPYDKLIMDKPYTNEMHIYDDKPPIVHPVDPKKGIAESVKEALDLLPKDEASRSDILEAFAAIKRLSLYRSQEK